MATKKTSTKKTATETVDIEALVPEMNATVVPTPKAAPIPREFKPTDPIRCISCTAGELIMIGKKTNTIYKWADYGDVAEVEYQDLNSAKISRSAFVYSPLFIIDDEDVLADNRWKDVKEMYDKIPVDDIEKLFDLNADALKKVLVSLPRGFQSCFKNIAATKIDEGTLDSIQTIKAIDSVLGTDLLSCLVGK